MRERSKWLKSGRTFYAAAENGVIQRVEQHTVNVQVLFYVIGARTSWANLNLAVRPATQPWLNPCTYAMPQRHTRPFDETDKIPEPENLL